MFIVAYFLGCRRLAMVIECTGIRCALSSAKEESRGFEWQISQSSATRRLCGRKNSSGQYMYSCWRHDSEVRTSVFWLAPFVDLCQIYGW